MPKFAILVKRYLGQYLLKHGISSPLSSYGLSPTTDLSSVAGDSLFSLLGDQVVDILKSELGDFGDTRDSLLDLYEVIYWSFLAIALNTFLEGKSKIRDKSYNFSFQI